MTCITVNAVEYVKANQLLKEKANRLHNGNAAAHESKQVKRKVVPDPGLRLEVPSDRLTVIEASAEVGLENALYIRGQGNGLSWDKGQRLKRSFGGKWIWTISKAKGKVLFRLLINDSIWAKGREVVVDAGKMIEVVPVF
jgi:hypothetical protein